MTGIELFVLPAILGGGSVTLGGALGAASLAAGVLSSVASSNQQAAAMQANAQAQRQQAANEWMQGEAEAARAQDEGRRRRATAFNTLAGSGVDPQDGSASDLMDDLTAGSALEASIARWRGTQARESRMQQARMLDAQARQKLDAKWWEAGSTLLTGGNRLLATR